eukprot:9108692-Alexandrium_andersonii.AAC.1
MHRVPGFCVHLSHATLLAAASTLLKRPPQHCLRQVPHDVHCCAHRAARGLHASGRTRSLGVQ